MAASEETRAPASHRATGVRVLPVAVGGCGACAASVRALLAPRYASRLAEQSISFTATPRHADVVLITGALTAREREAAVAYVEGVPEPRVLVAAGNCAIDGCVFAGSSYLVEGTAEALNAHVEIGGCPPEPEALLAAIAQAAQLLAEADDGVETEGAATGSGVEDVSDEAAEADEASDDDGRDDGEEGRDA